MSVFIRSHPVRDLTRRREWAARHDRCQCCGKTAQEAMRFLETHHLIKPGRSDEECNFLRLCWICHTRVEGLTVWHKGQRLRPLKLAHCLWLKRQHDPEEYDPERLAVLFHKALPEPEPLPESSTTEDT